MSLSAQDVDFDIERNTKEAPFGDYGANVAISGNYAVVGAEHENEFTGSATIFFRDDNGDWTEVQKLIAFDGQKGDWFGYSVAIHDHYIAIGAMFNDYDVSGNNYSFNSGAAYVFERDQCGTWSQVAKIVDGDRREEDLFGVTVGVFGNYVAVGSYKDDEDENELDSLLDAGSVQIFRKNSFGNWRQYQKIVSNDRKEQQWFGLTLSMHDSVLLVGTFNEYSDTLNSSVIQGAGAAYIYELNNKLNEWEYKQKIVASDRSEDAWFGRSVHVRGIKMIIGAENDSRNGEERGSAYIFQKDTLGNWIEEAKLEAFDASNSDHFGSAVSIHHGFVMIAAETEDNNANGGAYIENSGSVYMYYKNNAGTWALLRKLTESDRVANSRFGSGLAFQGNNFLVSSSNAVYWMQSDELSFYNTPGLKDTIIDTLCEGSVFNYRGRNFTETGLYYDTLKNQMNCDSIIIHALTFNPSPKDSIDTSLCNGDSIFLAGAYRYTAGTYIDSFITSSNCDSLIYYIVTLKGEADKIFPEVYVESCYSEFELSIDHDNIESYRWYRDEFFAEQLYSGNPVQVNISKSTSLYLKHQTNSCLIEALEVHITIEEKPNALSDFYWYKTDTLDFIDVLDNDMFIGVDMSILDSIENANLSIVNEQVAYNISSNAEWFAEDSFVYEICDQACPLNCDTAIVRLYSSEPPLLVSDFFTPNNDRINDYFVVENIESYSGVRLEIYDRNGLKVFSTYDYQNEFDGQFNGEDLPEGAYYYIMQRNELKPVTGWLIIER